MSYPEISAEHRWCVRGLRARAKGRERETSLESAIVALTFGLHEPRPVVKVPSELASMFGGLVFEVPPGVVTVTPTAPEPGGAVAVIELSLTTENDAAPAEPNLTEVAPVKPLPVIVTVDRSLLPAVSTPSECNRGRGGNDAAGSPAVRCRRSASNPLSGVLIVLYAASPSGNATFMRTSPAASTSVKSEFGLNPHVTRLSLPVS